VNGGFVMRYLNLETRQWTVLDFGIKFRDWEIGLFNRNDLVIYSCEFPEKVGGIRKYNFYKIGIR
jgi:hypothetical protein